MNIGIDIDNTITNTIENLHRYIKTYIEENNLDYKINMNASNTKNIVEWKSEEEHNSFAEKYLIKIVNTAKLKEKAVEYINKLKDEGNIVHIVTARSNNMFSDPYLVSEDFLKENNIKYDYLKASCENKDIYCTENNIKVLVDDEPQNIIDTSKYIKVIIPNDIHNQGIENENTIRVNNWDEIYYHINKIKEDIVNY